MFRIFFLLVCTFFFSLSASQKILIGIAGGTGSGKTTLAQKIQAEFPRDSVLICQDSYYRDLSHLPLHERAKTNFDHPNSLDFSMLRQHLLDLMENRTVDQPIYNFHTHSREAATKRVEPARVIIVEGILLLAALEVRDLFHLKIFIETDDDIRLLRRIQRDISERSRDFSSIKQQYLATVKPMHDSFVEPSKQFADIIIPMRNPNHPAFDLIITKIRACLKSS